jgi:RNA polymerase sigma factor (sigma-70 family)
MNAVAVQLLSRVASDEELVGLLADGQPEALACLNERYSGLLLSLAARSLDRPTAEEIVQDVLLKVWQHAHSFDPQRGSFRPWVLQIARRLTLNELRRRRSRPQIEADADSTLLDELPDDGPEPAERMVRGEHGAAVRAALVGLPPPLRRAVALAFIDELTHAEVAGALRVPLGTAKTRIRSGLHKLRLELRRSPECPACRECPECRGGCAA